MITATALPKVYVVSHRSEAQDMILRELQSEPIELVRIRDEQDYFENLDAIQDGCVLVEVCDNPALELSTIASIRKRQKSMQVIAFGEQWNVANAVNAMKLGAKEVCEIPFCRDQLKDAIYKALDEATQESLSLDETIPKETLDKLTTEEAGILRLMLQGQTAKEVGAVLDVSVRTFHYRKKSIFAKLGVKNRSEVIELIRRGAEAKPAFSNESSDSPSSSSDGVSEFGY